MHNDPRVERLKMSALEVSVMQPGGIKKREF